MKTKHFISFLVFLIIGTQCVDAQYYRSSSRHYGRTHSRSYADLVEVTLHQAGTLERNMPEGMYDRVRLLRIEGPLDEKDMKYITTLAKRSKVVNDEGKSVDNYLDVDLERASVMEKYGSRYNHDVLPRQAFQFATHLRSIVLPERLKSIGQEAFECCYDLEEVIMPPRVLELGESAFESCDDLRYFTVPDRLEVIGRRCFKGCTKLSRFDIPRGVQSIGQAAFDECPLEGLFIPAYCQIENDNPGFLPKLQAIDVDRYNRTYTSVDRALYDHDVTTLILYPSAFTGICRVPDGVEQIAPRAFYKSRVAEVQLPQSLRSIGAEAFSGNTKLSSINLPDGVGEIPVKAFYECTSLWRADLGPVREIGEYAFAGCTALQSINLDGGLTAIAPCTFERCRSLTDISLPSTVHTIGEKAFHECSGLRSIALSENLRSIGKQAFDRCGSLTDVALPAGILTIEEKTFYECTSLRTVTFPEGLQRIGKQAFQRCKQLGEVTLPAGVTDVDKEAFRECMALQSITLNEGLRCIGDNALRETAISRLLLPSTITRIGKKITEKCKAMQRVECHAPVPPELEGVANDKIELYVHASAIELYKQAKNWKKFKVIKTL